MSRAIANHYGSGDNVHCMMRTHNIKDDFISCVKQFQACGGELMTDSDHPNITDSNIHAEVDHAMEEGHAEVKRSDRSVGNHEACTQVFDPAMFAIVKPT